MASGSAPHPSDSVFPPRGTGESPGAMPVVAPVPPCRHQSGVSRYFPGAAGKGSWPWSPRSPMVLLQSPPPVGSSTVFSPLRRSRPGRSRTSGPETAPLAVRGSLEPLGPSSNLTPPSCCHPGQAPASVSSSVKRGLGLRAVARIDISPERGPSWAVPAGQGPHPPPQRLGPLRGNQALGAGAGVTPSYRRGLGPGGNHVGTHKCLGQHSCPNKTPHAEV